MFVIILSKIPMEQEEKLAIVVVVGLVGYCNARCTACSCIAVLAASQFDNAACR